MNYCLHGWPSVKEGGKGFDCPVCYPFAMGTADGGELVAGKDDAKEFAKTAHALLKIAIPFCTKNGKRIVIIDTAKNYVNFKD